MQRRYGFIPCSAPKRCGGLKKPFPYTAKDIRRKHCRLFYSWTMNISPTINGRGAFNGYNRSLRALKVERIDSYTWFLNSPTTLIKRRSFFLKQLKNLLKNHKYIRVEWEKRDSFGRILGKVYLDDIKSAEVIDVNLFMLEQGACHKYVKQPMH